MPKIIAGDAHPALAREVAAALGVSLGSAEVTRFADGEANLCIHENVRDDQVCILQPTCPPVAENLWTLALLVDAARAAGAARVVAVIPYFGYARQEERSRVGEPRGAQVASRLLGGVGVDHLVSLDLHAPALESALPMPLMHLVAEETFLPQIRAWGLKNVAVVSPDAGGLKRAQRYAKALDAELAVVAKSRSQPDVATPLTVLGDVEGRSCLMVDDMASTGRTLAGAAEVLRRAGAREVHAVFTHAVMAAGALDRILAAPLDRLMTSDSVPVDAHPRLQIASVAPQLAQAIRGLHSAPGGR